MVYTRQQDPSTSHALRRAQEVYRTNGGKRRRNRRVLALVVIAVALVAIYLGAVK